MSQELLFLLFLIIRANVLSGRNLWRGEVSKHFKVIRDSHALKHQFQRSDKEVLAGLQRALSDEPTIQQRWAA